MRSRELAGLAVDLTRQLSMARSEVAAYRLLALTAIAHAGELSREVEMISARRYVHQQRTTAQRPDAMRRRQEAA